MGFFEEGLGGKKWGGGRVGGIGLRKAMNLVN